MGESPKSEQHEQNSLYGKMKKKVLGGYDVL